MVIILTLNSKCEHASTKPQLWRGMDGHTFVILFCNSKIICLAFRDLFLSHELRKAKEGLIIVFIYNRYLLTS